MLLLIAALLSVSGAGDLAGLYEIDQMEMAGGLELRADGRFSFALDYGAVSETAEGQWTTGPGGTVTLTTDPMPPKEKCDRGFASACFRGTPVVREKDALILYRWETRIVLKPVQRAP